MNRPTIAAMVLLLFSGCSAALYKPLPEHATASVSHQQLVEGRALYVEECGGCHSLYLPYQYTPEVWSHNLDEMQERSKVSDAEKKLIFEYLMGAPKSLR